MLKNNYFQGIFEISKNISYISYHLVNILQIEKIYFLFNFLFEKLYLRVLTVFQK